ncbi:uncharacterized protein RJT21DRAFT_138042 [Scheffersomyces amazonensis]|uniref:uncharacterized protein n=1 Tax=Scheffersomyces amazonensis TaxID=1078765 RepID=UPI00315CB947
MNRQFRRYNRWGILRRFHMSSRHRNFQSLHETFVEKKSMDKVHRSFYNSLISEKTLYSKSKITIQPTIRHLLCLLEMETNGQTDHITLNSNIIPTKKDQLLESIIFHIILSVYYHVHKERVNSLFRNQIYQSQISHLNNLAKHSTKQIESNEINEIISSILGNSTTEDIPKSLKIAIQKFTIVCEGKYNGTDLKKWILSLTAGNIRDSCMHLEGLKLIPPFVLSDILFRTALSREDFQLQQDIWLHYINIIGIYYVDKISSLKTCFDNLVTGCIFHDISSLPKLINDSIIAFQNPRKGFGNILFIEKYNEELLWHLAMVYLKSRSEKSIASIVSAHELVVKLLSSQKEKLNETLDLKAFSAITMIVSLKSQNMGQKLLEIAEKRYLAGEFNNLNKTVVAYHISKLFLSESPEELLRNFNLASESYNNSASLWLIFLMKLKDFKLLTPLRSKRVLTEILKRKDSLILTKDIFAVLMEPINELKDFNEMINLLDNQLTSRLRSIILPKYIKILYDNHNMDVQLLRFPWDKDNTDNLGTLDYARHIYYDCIKHKSVNTIATMLKGEAMAAPAGVYGIYKEQLIDKDIKPNEGCLEALISASSQSSNGLLIWDDVYAPQVAISEFNRLTGEINCSNFIWRTYIRMLAKYRYIHELAGIIQQWEQSQFIPDQYSLLLLLASLPIEHSRRYIAHFEKVRENTTLIDINPSGSNSDSDSDSSSWPWPTFEELELFKARNLSLVA